METAVAPGRMRRKLRRLVVATLALALGTAGYVGWWTWTRPTVALRPVEGPLPDGDLIVSVQRGYQWNNRGMPGYRPPVGETVRVEPGTGRLRTLLHEVAMDLRVGPDGESIAYRDAAEDVWVLRAGRDEPESVPGLHGTPIWSPDGRAILCSYQLDPFGSGACETVRINLQTKSRTVLPLLPTDEARDLSPDGKLLAVTTMGKGKDWLQIDVIGLDGKGRRRLTAGGCNLLPRFAADGRRVAFVHGEADTPIDRWTIRTIGIDGRDERTVAEGVYGSSRVSWSPDGTTLAVRSRDRAFLVGADGGAPRPLDVTVRREFRLIDPVPRGPRTPLSFGALEWARPAR